MREEESRGRRQVRKVVTTERKRRIEQAAARLADPNCDERQFLEAIRALGQQEGSPEFEASLKLWREYHGKS
jgi:hypothetical protein